MGITILDALASPALLGRGPFAAQDSWHAWRVFLGAAYGLPLSGPDRRLFRACTGRSRYAPPPGGWPEVVCITGRQSGKSRVAATLSAFEAALAPPVRDGEEYVLLVAQDLRGAIRVAYSYVCSAFEGAEAMRNLVTGRTQDTLSLANGLRLGCYPCRPSSLRGLRARVVLLDELAYYRSSEGYATDTEMLRAARPCLATTGGKLVILSSPYGQSGCLWDLHRKHHGRDDSPVLVWQADAPTMNPTLPADYLARMREDDPEAYRSEVLGEFRAGLSTLLDPEAIGACVVPGRRELPPVADLSYSAFVDPSGGRADAFTLAIGHRDGERAVVDALRAWRPPFNPAGVVAEAAELLRHYRVVSVTGDRYAGEWPREQFRAHGIGYDTAAAAKSDLYLGLVAHVNGERVELPDDPELLRELRGLERRRGPSGKDRVDHRPGAHDDRANAVAGLAYGLVGRAQACSWEDLYGDNAQAAPGGADGGEAEVGVGA